MIKQLSNNYKYMKTQLLVILLCLCLCVDSERGIISRQISTSYDQYGFLSSFQLNWKPSQPIYAQDYIKATFPQPIHDTNNMTYFELSTSNSHQLIFSSLSSNIEGSTYYLPMNQQIEANVWYKLTIYVTTVLTLNYGYIALEIVGDWDNVAYSYCWNNAFQYYHIQQQSSTLQSNNTFTTNIISNVSSLPSDRYAILMQVTSSLSFDESVNIFINFKDPSFNVSSIYTNTSANTSAQTSYGFQFIGSCHTLCDSSYPSYQCIHADNCEVNSQYLNVQLPYIQANQTYLLQFYVMNPVYVSEAMLQTYLKDKKQKTIGLSYPDTLLKVDFLYIYEQQVYLLWNIPYERVVNEMGFGLFVNANNSLSLSVSSFDIGFSVSSVTPIQTTFVVKVYVGAQSVLQASINHNLPSFVSSSGINCKYVMPYIQCSNVNAFTNLNQRFYVRGRGYFMETDDLTQFGSVMIELQNQSNPLFSPLIRNMNITTVVIDDYHDYAGIHGSSSRIKQTMIVSHNDTLLPNSTANSIQDFLYTNQSFVGIDPSVQPLQLLFLTAVSQAQMSSNISSTNTTNTTNTNTTNTTNSTQKYTMKIFYNTNIMTTSDKGLDVMAYSQTQGIWKVQSLPCYKDSSLTPTTQKYECQKYDDHVYNAQQDNILTTHTDYGVYEFVCGDGSVVQCSTGDCKDKCRILRGGISATSISDQMAGIVSIRNVNFIQNYHSPVQANQNDLDFIMAFYHADVLVSASVINGYTVNSTRPSYLKANLVNNYNDNSTNNEGSRIPTMIKLQGHFTLQQIGSNTISKLGIHIPQSISILNFVQPSSQNNIGCSTNDCKVYEGGTSLSIIDTWTKQTSIIISSLPSLTNDFQILIPVTYPSPTTLYSLTVSLHNSNNQIVSVFRFNGSSIAQNINYNSQQYVAQMWAPVDAWTQNSTNWVANSSQYIYEQAINLDNIVHFSASNTISMHGTTMNLNDNNPSSTFSSAYVNIFSQYSFPTANGIDCVVPFSYKYQQTYDIWVLWCPLFVDSLNDIVINYPIYPSLLGAQFPFELLFAYSYSDDVGNMIGYRVQDNTKTTMDSCSTIINTIYNVNKDNPQINSLTVSFRPVQLGLGIHRSMLLMLTIPVDIPIQMISCSSIAKQSQLDISLNCIVLNGSTSNVFSLQLQYAQTSQIQIVQLQLQIKTVKSSASTITQIQPYYVDIYLPFTNSLTNQPAYMGQTYSPYQSHLYSCSNSFTYSSIFASTQYISLTEPSLSAQSSQYYASLSFNATFSTSTNIFTSSSTLQITFSDTILNNNTICRFQPDNHYWKSYTYSTNTIELIPIADIHDFTLQEYRIRCNNIITSGNSIQVSMIWLDQTYTIQQTQTNLLIDHTQVNSVTQMGTGHIVNKTYNSVGYRGQYIFNITYTATNTQILQLYMDFISYNIYNNYLQCLVYENNQWNPVMCYSRDKDSLSQVYIQYIPSSTNYIQLKIYGIQQTQSSSNILMLLKSTSTYANTTSYYVYDIADIISSIVDTDPFQIDNYYIDADDYVHIVYSSPVDYTGPLYVIMDQFYIMSSIMDIMCYLNDSNTSCIRKHPDIIQVDPITHTNNHYNTLRIGTLKQFHLQANDTQHIVFKLFTINLDGTIQRGSHSHLQQPLLTSTIPKVSHLIWQLPVVSEYFHKVYIGYYGPHISLLPVSQTQYVFVESFNISFNSSSAIQYTYSYLQCDLGQSAQFVSIGLLNDNASYLGLDILQFSQYSQEYQSIDNVRVYVSNQKCQLQTQFQSYNIFSGGLTIPIVIDISNCRPIQALYFTYSVDTTYIQVDTSLSTTSANQNTTYLYVILKHTITAVTIGSTFTLSITLSSDNPTVLNSYQLIPSTNIIVIDQSSLVGNPQGKQPVINSLTYNTIDLTLQCNEPATIYWGIGLYPTMLGIYSQQIQARLVQLQNGLIPKSYSVYSWSKQIYGLEYVQDFNIQKNLVIDQLQGGLSYVFKYFCVGQTGKSSGGKITLFETPASSHSLIKVIISFQAQLTYTQANIIACAISQQLIIPYYQSITSTFSNCLNTSDIFYSAETLYYDQIIDGQYSYNFYVNSQRKTVKEIQTILSTTLLNNPYFLDATVPTHQSIRIQSLANAYQPTIYTTSVQQEISSITLTVNVGFANSYLIAAIIHSHFDAQTMAVPPQYLVKQGFFSQGTRFDQVFMKYGRQDISVTFNNLQSNSEFSIFYYITVDDSALNSRYSQVTYLLSNTAEQLVIDLSQRCLGFIFSLALLFLLSL